MYALHPIKVTLANSIDQDKMQHTAASDQGLHCLHFGQEFL